MLRMSAKWPVTAAAAAIAGLTKCVRPPAALTAFKVTVAGGGAALARVQAVIIHGQAHGTAR